jgi:hypothetical protein
MSITPPDHKAALVIIDLQKGILKHLGVTQIMLGENGTTHEILELLTMRFE